MSVASTEIRRKVREQYARAGNAYVLSETHRLGKDLARLVEVAAPAPDMLALDIATGGGHTALALAPRVAGVVLLDLTPEMLGHARTFVEESGAHPIGYVAAAAEQLPFPDALFDLVSCRIAPHHFADVRAYVREVSRVLVAGGCLVMIDSLAPDDPVLNDFINTLERRRDPSHVRSYSRNEWERYFSQAGLRLEHAEVILKRHEYESWAERGGLNPEQRRELSDWALSAAPETLSYFDVQRHGGRMQSFADHKLLVKARKG